MQKDIKETLKKIESGQYDADDEVIVKRWLFFLKSKDLVHPSESELNETSEEIWSRLHLINEKHKPIRKIFSYRKIASAAAVLFLLGFAVLYYFKEQQDLGIVQSSADIAPGTDGATLTLASGRTIAIADALEGNIALESGVKISKSKAGQLIYQVTDANPDAVGYNTLKTSKGEQIQVMLPDQTRVYLNAESSLSYPTSFVKLKNREVSLNGEGYFEVAHNNEFPFIVRSAGHTIHVLGTKFNVNSYDQYVKTTLLKGAVRLSLDKNPLVRTTLEPGQQAQVHAEGIRVKKVDANDYIGWTKNLFVFNDIPLTEIMKTLERWYNVDVSYPVNFKDSRFFAEIPRDRTLIQVLKDLEKAGNYSFELKGRRIMVR